MKIRQLKMSKLCCLYSSFCLVFPCLSCQLTLVLGWSLSSRQDSPDLTCVFEMLREFFHLLISICCRVMWVPSSQLYRLTPLFSSFLNSSTFIPSLNYSKAISSFFDFCFVWTFLSDFRSTAPLLEVMKYFSCCCRMNFPFLHRDDLNSFSYNVFLRITERDLEVLSKTEPKNRDNRCPWWIDHHHCHLGFFVCPSWSWLCFLRCCHLDYFPRFLQIGHQ